MAEKNNSMSVHDFKIAVAACVNVAAKFQRNEALIYTINANQPLINKYAEEVFNAFCGNRLTLTDKNATLISLIEKTAEKVIAKLQLYAKEEDLKAFFEQYFYADAFIEDDVIALENGQHDEYYWQ